MVCYGNGAKHNLRYLVYPRSINNYHITSHAVKGRNGKKVPSLIFLVGGEPEAADGLPSVCRWQHRALFGFIGRRKNQLAKANWLSSGISAVI